MNKIEKELKDFKDTLNTDYREQYAVELGLDPDDKSINIAEEISMIDNDSMDFNLGFEQGYMRGLEVALKLQYKNQ